MGPRKIRNEESWTDCEENKTFLKFRKIIFSVAKDRNQWLDCRTTEETSERSGDCWWGGGGSRGGKGVKRMFRDLDGFIHKDQAPNGLKMSFFFFIFSSTFFPAFVSCMCVFVWITVVLFCFTTLRGMWDLSFLTRSWTVAHRVGAPSLNLDQGSPVGHCFE